MKVKLFLIAFFFFLLLVLIPSYLFWRTLPSHHERKVIKDLQNSVQVDWDLNGVPVIRAKTLEDAVTLQGYITARDRFFQMELTRRKMKGTLSELIGPKTLKWDKISRTYGYDKVAEMAIGLMPESRRVFLEKYSSGVNEFISSHSKPWECTVLGYDPKAWEPKDSLLVVLSMFESLNYQESSSEEAYSILRKKLSPSLVSFLTPEWGFLDAPILADPRVLPKSPVPSAEELNVRTQAAQLNFSPQDFSVGSNAFAIAGQWTESGFPLIASDPHLDLRAPNLWYRLKIATSEIEVTGVSIPGIPEIIIGTNHKVGWAFTNSAINNVDQVEIPLGEIKNFPTRKETVFIKGEAPEVFQVEESPWGPIIDKNADLAIALQWDALNAQGLSELDIKSLNEAENTKDLLEAFSHWAGPAQNAVFATRLGEIGWTIAGKLPKRVGFDGLARTFRDQNQHWEGYVPRSEFPLLINPPEGFIVSANQRSVGVGPKLPLFGSHWPNAARARRITDLLSQKKKWTASSAMSIQSDVTSLTHLWYRDRLLECPLSSQDNETLKWLKPVYSLLKDWDGRATENSSAYPVLRKFRTDLMDNLIGPIAKAIDFSHGEVLLERLQTDTLMATLLQQKPIHLLSNRYENYCDALQKSALSAAQTLSDTPEGLMNLRWGAINQSEFKHPLSAAFPKFIQGFLDLPKREMSGDNLIPNVRTPHRGASMRMVVDLGKAELSVFGQPGGQSGHPLSAHYKDLFDDWLSATPRPFEPGQSVESELFKVN